MFAPDYVVETIETLSPAILSDLGIRGLLLDVDCTLKPYRAKSVTPAVKVWAESLRQSGIRMIIISNGRSQRVEPVASQLGIPWIAPAWKPLPFALWRAVSRLGAPRHAVAMVGDQLFADVLAARLAGVRSVLVRPLAPRQEPWWSRWKRPLEFLILGNDLRRWGKFLQPPEGSPMAPNETSPSGICVK